MQQDEANQMKNYLKWTTAAVVLPVPTALYAAYKLFSNGKRIFGRKNADDTVENIEPILGDQVGLPSWSVFAEALRKYWPTTDFTTDNFLVGMSSVANIDHSMTAENNRMLITMQSGSKIIWMAEMPTEDASARGNEFIGLVPDKNPQPLGEVQAYEIAVLAAARGWEKINIHGSEADREELWIAANKVGLEVVGYDPSPQALKRLEAWKSSNQGVSQDIERSGLSVATSGHTQTTAPAKPTSQAPAPKPPAPKM